MLLGEAGRLVPSFANLFFMSAFTMVNPITNLVSNLVAPVTLVTSLTGSTLMSSRSSSPTISGGWLWMLATSYLLLLPAIPQVTSDHSIMYQMSPENTLACREKNKKLLEEVETAQLAAHRCMIRDVAVKVPDPEDFIAESIFPSHIIVPRCSGVCLDKVGETCLPKRKPKVVSHEVVLYSINGTQVCRHIELEHHRSPCRCNCLLAPGDCGQNQVFSTSSCSCSCDRSANAAKYSCALDPRRLWDNRKCACICRVVCLPGQELDSQSCSCHTVVQPSCSVGAATLASSHPAKVATYIGLGALTMVGLTIAVTLYYIVVKKSPYTDLAVGGPQAAYTITINQNSATIDESTGLTSDPDTEKTKF